MTKHKKFYNGKICQNCGHLKELMMFGLYGKNKICDPCLGNGLIRKKVCERCKKTRRIELFGLRAKNKVCLICEEENKEK